MLATPSRLAAVSPLLVMAVVAACVVLGYAWFRGNAAADARSGIRLSPGSHQRLVPWPQRHWSYGPVDESSDGGHLSTRPDGTR